MGRLCQCSRCESGSLRWGDLEVSVKSVIDKSVCKARKVLCDRTFAGETLHRELETDQSMGTTKVQLVSFTAVTYRIMGEGSPKPTPAW